MPLNWLFRIGELSGLILLLLVALRLHRRAYGADKLVIGEDVHHGLRDALNTWATFGGILLIAVLCWFLAISMLGEGWIASCVALCLFFFIGLNLLHDELGDSDDESDDDWKR